MSQKVYLKLIMTILILVIIFSLSGCSKDLKDNFYEIPSFFWFKITFFKPIYAIIVYVAIWFGLVSYFIGYNAGGQLNKTKIIRAIAIASGVGILGRSFMVYIKIQFYNFLKVILPIKPEYRDLIAGTISDTIFYIIWIIFIAGIAVFIYETFVVTAKEARLR